MSSLNKKKVNFLKDIPNEKDLIGSHIPIADSIYDVILNEEGGRTIGLKGKWGSGKSTVINLLIKKINQNNHLKCVVYDAWAHEGDPLRLPV